MSAPLGDKTTIRVSIFNQTYTLRASGDPGEVQEVAAMVDELMRSIAVHTGSGDPTRAAVLACLHLADQLKIAQAESDTIRQQVTAKAIALANLLDQV